MSRHCSSVKSVGYDLSFIAPLPQNLTPTRRVNNSPDQMSRDNNCLKFSKPCNGHALKGLVKNWWASDTSLKDNAMEASDATNSFVRNHAGVSDQVPSALATSLWPSGSCRSSFTAVQSPHEKPRHLLTSLLASNRARRRRRRSRRP